MPILTKPVTNRNLKGSKTLLALGNWKVTCDVMFLQNTDLPVSLQESNPLFQWVQGFGTMTRPFWATVPPPPDMGQLKVRSWRVVLISGRGTLVEKPY